MLAQEVLVPSSVEKIKCMVLSLIPEKPLPLLQLAVKAVSS